MKTLCWDKQSFLLRCRCALMQEAWCFCNPLLVYDCLGEVGPQLKCGSLGLHGRVLGLKLQALMVFQDGAILV